MRRILVNASRERQARTDATYQPRTLAKIYGVAGNRGDDYQPNTFANINGATIVASDSIINRGVVARSLPQVIFSFGTAPEYDPKLVVESLIWQKYPHSGTCSVTRS